MSAYDPKRTFGFDGFNSGSRALPGGGGGLARAAVVGKASNPAEGAAQDGQNRRR